MFNYKFLIILSLFWAVLYHNAFCQKGIFYSKEISYIIECDSLKGKGFKIINNDSSAYKIILPLENKMVISILKDRNWITYSANSQTVKLQPELILMSGGKNKCEICSKRDHKSNRIFLDKECLQYSRLTSVVTNNHKQTNINGLIPSYFYQSGEIELRVYEKGNRNNVVKIFQIPYSSKNLGELVGSLEQNKSYLIDASFNKYSIVRRDKSILSFEIKNPNFISIEVE